MSNIYNLSCKPLFCSTLGIFFAVLYERSWDEDRCLAYMLEHTVVSEAAARNEIKRYIYIPGQACCYLYGFKKFLQLREMAIHQLGKLNRLLFVV